MLADDDYDDLYVETHSREYAGHKWNTTCRGWLWERDMYSPIGKIFVPSLLCGCTGLLSEGL